MILRVYAETNSRSGTSIESVSAGRPRPAGRNSEATAVTSSTAPPTATAGTAASTYPHGVSSPPAPVNTAVSTAIPRATPISRTVELVPEPFAVSCGERLASTAVDDGANTNDMPIPAATNAGSIVVYATSAVIVAASQISPAACSVRPVTIRMRVPTRGMMMPAMGAMIIGASVHGVVWIAASSGEAPCTTCRNWIRMKTAPNMPKLNPNPTTFAIEKLRSRNNRSGSSGDAVRLSQTRNAASSAAPPIRPASTSNEVHPASLPRTMPKTMPRTPRPARSTPGMSSRTRAPNALGRTQSTNGIARMPTGTLIQKIDCQLRPSTMAPPSSGPTATPSPASPPQMPIASGRRLDSTAPESSESDSGMMPAPPMPWIARATISCPGSVLRAANTDATVKIAMPAMKIVRRPSRSPRPTMSRMRLANTRV